MFVSHTKFYTNKAYTPNPKGKRTIPAMCYNKTGGLNIILPEDFVGRMKLQKKRNIYLMYGENEDRGKIRVVPNENGPIRVYRNQRNRAYIVKTKIIPDWINDFTGQKGRINCDFHWIADEQQILELVVPDGLMLKTEVVYGLSNNKRHTA